MDKLSLIVCMCACVLLIGCSGGVATVEPGSGAETAIPPLGGATDETELPVSGLPAFPLLDLPEPRFASVTSTRTLSATDVWQSADVGTAVIGDAMAFSNLANPAWAIYKFGGLYETDEPRLFSFQLENDVAWLPQHLYIGISDFAAQSWNWYDAHYPAADFSFAIPPADIPKPSPSGNLYVCVLTMSDGLMLHSLSMSFDYVAPPPVDLRASDGTYQDGIELTWTDPDVTYEGGQPFNYDGIVIERATSQAGPWDEIATVTSGTTSYEDTDALALGPVKLYYRLHLVKAGEAGHLGVPDQGYVDFAPVLLPITGQTQGVRTPYAVQLSVLGSYDPDGGALKYEWKFEDGPWEATDILPTISHTFMHNTDVVLRATDDEGSVSNYNYFQTTAGTAISLAAKYSDGSVVGFGYGGCLDAQKNLIAGLGEYSDQAFCKLDSNLNPVWVRGWEGLRPRTCCTDGSFYAMDTQNKVARFSGDGDLLWAREISYDAPSWYLESCWVDPSNNLWMLGTGNYYTNIQKILVCAFDTSGQLLFFKTLSGQEEPGYVHATSIAFDDSGNALVRAGMIASSRRTFILKLSQIGNLVWQKEIQDSAGTDFPYWGGFTRVSDSFVCVADDAHDGYLFALDSDGTVQWARTAFEHWLTSYSLSGDSTHLYLSAYGSLGVVVLPDADSLGTRSIYAKAPSYPGQLGAQTHLFYFDGSPNFDGSASFGNWSPYSNTYLDEAQVLAVDATDIQVTDENPTVAGYSLVESTDLPEIVEEPNHTIFCRF